MKSRLNNVLESYREFVTTHRYEDEPILTAYVDLDTTNPDSQRDRPAWQIELKNEAKRLEAKLDPEQLKRRDTQKKWVHTEEMVMSYLQGRKTTGRSVVLFTNLEDIIGVDLPVPMETRLYYGLPQIKDLLFALDQFKKYLVVLCSGAEVRIIEVFLARTTDELRVETEHELARLFGRNSKTQTVESRRDAEFERRHAREVAEGINEYFLGDPDFERLILGGNQKQAHAVKNALHPAVRETLVAVESIDFKQADIEIARKVKAIADRYELEHDLAVVDDLVARYNRNRTAVVEAEGVELALKQGRVKTLVIPYPIDSEQFDALIVDATTGGASIEFVYGEAAEKLKNFGGIGATLFYSEG